jgi:hypothetical protein
VDSFSCFNFVLILHKVKFHPELYVSLGTTYLLTMTKPSSEVHPIAMEETLYQFTNYILCLQFQDTFATHFSPHQFGVTTKGECEIIIHGIKCTLDLHHGCSSTRRGKHFQFDVKKGHIARTSYNRWGHHITYPLCLCILCI